MDENKTTYRIFHVGGDPKEIAFLADNLSKKVDDIQHNGWIIESIDQITNNYAWDNNIHAYVETIEYIIVAKKLEIE